jgi:hypothetical protein
MAVTVTDYADVEARAAELGLCQPDPFAILPRGFEAGAPEALVHESEAATIRKVLKENGLDVQLLAPPTERLPSVVQRSADWIAPTILVGSMLWTQNPMAVSVALGVLDSYISDFFKGKRASGTVKLSFVVERSRQRTYAHVTYEGPTSGLGARELAQLRRDHRHRCQPRRN